MTLRPFMFLDRSGACVGVLIMNSEGYIERCWMDETAAKINSDIALYSNDQCVWQSIIDNKHGWGTDRNGDRMTAQEAAARWVACH